MEVVLSWKLLFSTRAWHSIRFSTQAPLHALFIPVLIGLCSYNNVLAIWGHSRWKLTLTQIVPLRAFSFLLTAILNSQAGCQCTLVSRLPFPVPRSPFPVPRSPFPVLVTSVSVTVSIVACSSKRKEKQHGFFVIFGINTGLSHNKTFQIDTLRFAARDFLL